MKRLQILEIKLGYHRNREEMLHWLIQTGEEKLDGQLVTCPSEADKKPAS